MSDETRKLKVRVREVVYPEGEREERALVSCPRRNELIDVEECQACPHLEALSDGEVRCRAPPPPPAPEPESLEARLRTTRVSEVMTTHVTCLDGELYLAEAAQVILAHGLHAAPIVEDRGVPIGMVSLTDLLRHDDRQHELVEDTMTTEVVSIPEEATLAEATALLSHRRLHRVPVVTSGGALVGVISSTDLLRWLTRALEQR